jgi:hypothetical protein
MRDNGDLVPITRFLQIHFFPQGVKAVKKVLFTEKSAC